MKYFVLFLSILLFNCQHKSTSDNVINTYNAKVNSYDKIEYHIRRIDTFSQDNTWNKTGQVLIEKNKKDTLFGMSFFTNSYTHSNNYLYDNYNGFEISIKNNTYEIIYSKGFLGSPGGQLVSDIFFGLDNIYKTVEIVETKNKFQLEYTFENDTVYDIRNIKKTIDIDKTTFLPIKIVKTFERGGERAAEIFQFDSVLVNDKVKNSIENQKKKLQAIRLIKEEAPIITSLIGTEFNTESLPNLWDDKPVEISNNFPLLISFWEFWCSPCINSLPKLKLLQNTYKSKITVIGVSTQSPEKAKHILLSKNIEYINLKGSETLLEKYQINSFPTYFLVDKNGIIIKKYSNFSEDIEKDIKTL
ncbi:TlpA family protein disulfide reductase [Xanthomarina spongicola]|uniref:Thiol-disulfide isomerase/thioredoxin n=1 Tax=Xanthomarina spongicola TaxID=570520 RepID=A0A316DQV8_9FLAO|nr:TlpA disulfide reductase family protein [Xanthomarina spongicola]PWK20627.1 thiol-disulfide isomerase/thioredoxin [Xanthomarina spongicola]